MFERYYFENEDINYTWTDIENISTHIQKAVIASEDQRFFIHNGIDKEALDKALQHNKNNPKKRRRGASTITMQTAKNVFLWNGRSYLRKFLEGYFSILIDAVWGKKRVMEVYLNVIEWDNGVYGINEASKKYFKKIPNTLTKKEASLLAAILPNPRPWNANKPTTYINKRASKIQKEIYYIKLEY